MKLSKKFYKGEGAAHVVKNMNKKGAGQKRFLKPIKKISISIERDIDKQRDMKKVKVYLSNYSDFKSR